MASTTNYSWSTPDDTALVKDGASAIRTLGSSVDTTVKALNPSTTLGDIEYRSSTANTNTRLGIGSTGQVLTVSGGVPSWATSAGGTANWSLLNSGGTALTGAATITVSGISGKDKIMVLISSASSASGSSEFRIRLNADSGSNYRSVGAQWLAPTSYDVTNLNSIDTTTTYIALMKNMTEEFYSSSGAITFTGCNSSGLKAYNAIGSGSAFSGQNSQRAYATQGFYSDSATITSVSVLSSVGNFDGGTIFVYTSA